MTRRQTHRSRTALSRSKEKLDLAEREGAVASFTAGDTVIGAIRETTGGGANVSVDALGSSATAVPGILSLRKGGRHLHLGGTGKEDRGIIGLPVDAMLFQELSFSASLGCPTTSYPGLLSMVASGALKPERLVQRSVDIGSVNRILTGMTDYKTTGFNVITSWAAAPTVAAR